MAEGGGLPPPSPFQRLIGYEIADWAAGRAVLRLTLTGDHANRHGLPHGGVHATLLDTAMGLAGCHGADPARPVLAVTLALTVQFTGRPGDARLLCEGRVTGGGRRIFFAEAEVRDGAGGTVARGTGTFRYRTGAGPGD